MVRRAVCSPINDVLRHVADVPMQRVGWLPDDGGHADVSKNFLSVIRTTFMRSRKLLHSI